MNIPLTIYCPVIGVLALTSGCAHTGIAPIGQDTYMVTRQGWVSTQSVTQLRGEVFNEMSAFCASQSEYLQSVTKNDTSGFFGLRYPVSEA
jgi:hypothetical protein